MALIQSLFLQKNMESGPTQLLNEIKTLRRLISVPGSKAPLAKSCEEDPYISYKLLVSNDVVQFHYKKQQLFLPSPLSSTQKKSMENHGYGGSAYSIHPLSAFLVHPRKKTASKN